MNSSKNPQNKLLIVLPIFIIMFFLLIWWGFFRKKSKNLSSDIKISSSISNTSTTTSLLPSSTTTSYSISDTSNAFNTSSLSTIPPITSTSLLPSTIPPTTSTSLSPSTIIPPTTSTSLLPSTIIPPITSTSLLPSTIPPTTSTSLLPSTIPPTTSTSLLPSTTLNPLFNNYIVIYGTYSKDTKLSLINSISDTVVSLPIWQSQFNTNFDCVIPPDALVILTTKSQAITCKFNVPTGTYIFVLRSLAPTSNADSVFVSLDGVSKGFVSITKGTEQTNTTILSNISLTEGQHTIAFSYREPLGLVELKILMTEGTIDCITIPIVDVLLDPTKVYTYTTRLAFNNYIIMYGSDSPSVKLNLVSSIVSTLGKSQWISQLNASSSTFLPPSSIAVLFNNSTNKITCNFFLPLAGVFNIVLTCLAPGFNASHVQGQLDEYDPIFLTTKVAAATGSLSLGNVTLQPIIGEEPTIDIELESGIHTLSLTPYSTEPIGLIQLTISMKEGQMQSLRVPIIDILKNPNKIFVGTEFSIPILYTTSPPIFKTFPSPSLTVVNVKDFGAVGDGNTNDTTSLLNAYESVSLWKNGGVLYFPRGTYMVNPSTDYCFTVRNQQNLVFQGDGLCSTIKVIDGSDSQKGIFNLQYSTNITIQNLTLDANAFNALKTGAGTHCIRCEDMTGVNIKNMYLTNASFYGIGFQPGTFINITIDNVTIFNVGSDGIDFKNKHFKNRAINISNVVIRDHSMTNSGKPGIDCRGPISLYNINISAPTSLANGMNPVGIRSREGNVGNGLGGKLNVLNAQLEDLFAGVVIEPRETESGFSNIVTVNCSNGFWIMGASCKFSNCSVIVETGKVGNGYLLSKCTNCAFINCNYINNNYVTVDGSHGWKISNATRCFLSNCEVINGYYGFRNTPIIPSTTTSIPLDSITPSVISTMITTSSTPLGTVTPSVTGTGSNILENCRVKGSAVPFSAGSGTEILLNCTMSTTNGNTLSQIGKELQLRVLNTSGYIRLKSTNSFIIDSPKLIFSNAQVSNTRGNFSGNYLILSVNNIEYKIPLYNMT